ncbi:hypothetical protein Fsol_00721 [Candidatus Fokinia solitaria]|uniref:Uncharacterized protein n=1 Tax=Candidatus Fokinia solitaria TaxID=1802984 RepID=A0A2U8BTP9_9RICK|nr:HU family DNA-binding protein [Candidatus Fokinia solitaria]AWD33497.1 hypothetical protein Fsol_00721 [Candidatus Fokinia solitaria]
MELNNSILLLQQVSSDVGYSPEKASKCIKTVVSAMIETLVEEKKLTIKYLGTISVDEKDVHEILKFTPTNFILSKMMENKMSLDHFFFKSKNELG